ncbi:methyltransferase domain-containing protein [Paralimibaculum aggregatum]|uniref:Methyltransferase domain-containing protein n=1 Tax=Paralimibaculum aggregatum TaxID=3036245 RepID=A0ABQ6LMR0_9RHOB|nr:class I SAM-dependent methyltransferase [Limibaculum sp. NKW23]GMG84481.1 methyltransferase domain-containing protein [Limibaculum sp. NKW23]
MDARLQLRVQRYGWDAAAPYYHAGWQAQLRPAHDRLLDVAAAKPGQKVLETACGSGLVTLRLAEQVGAEGHVLATDLSERMVADLRSRLAEAGVANVETARMAAEALDVPSGAFDAAICALGLMYTPDAAAAVAEMGRVVRPGGTVAATVWGERRNCGWAEVFPIVDARVASEVCPLFFGTGAPGALARLFEAAGLEEVREHRQSELLAFRSEREVTDAVLLGGPVALAVKRFEAEVWDAVRREFLSSVSTCRAPDGSYRIPGEFVTVVGRRPID